MLVSVSSLLLDVVDDNFVIFLGVVVEHPSEITVKGTSSSVEVDLVSSGSSVPTYAKLAAISVN